MRRTPQRANLCDDARQMPGATGKDQLGIRFDDLSQGGVAIDFGVPERVLVADSSHQVLPLLRKVEEETTAGWWAAGFISYEAATCLNQALPTRQPQAREVMGSMPLAWFGLFAHPQLAERLGARASGDRPYKTGPWQPAVDAAAYRAKVARIRDRIRAGETYQCNLTVPLRTHVSGDLFELYRDLALAQCGAYNAYLDTGRYVVASASPELFFEWEGDCLTTRPMKGTAPRGRWSEEDAVSAEELIRSPKERAENVMIVDLIRNDLGKVARAGSVAVEQLFALERFPTVWQMTSTVTAQVPAETRLTDILSALFPCGSVTGVPKARTMSLIADLEESRRGVYCGAVGVVAPPGAKFRARFSVAIRTVVVDRQTGDAVYGAGGGITWDSLSAAEHDEMMTKAAILRSVPEEFQLLETMAFLTVSGVRNQEHHLARLVASAEYFGFRLDPDSIRASLKEAVSGAATDARVRLMVDRNGLCSVELSPLPAPASAPVRLAIDLEPVQSSEIWLYHKTTRRETYQRRSARHPDADDVIMVNERGQLTETTVANLAVQRDGIWYTPPLDAGCLPGVQRGLLLANGELNERVLTSADLRQAEGIALMSSLRGWRAAVLTDIADLARTNRHSERLSEVQRT
ncbi:MAG: aminodeoxychorismate synthase component I [Candidatus Dormiibacterota bacterium]